MDFSELPDAFDAPVKVTFKDKTTQDFPRLVTEDYVKSGAEIAGHRKAMSMKLIPANASAMDRFNIMRSLTEDETTLDVIRRKLYTLSGAERVLNASLVRAGVADAAERRRLIDKIPVGYRVSIAIDVSALFEKVAEDKKAKSDASAGSFADVAAEAAGDGPLPGEGLATFGG